MTICKVKSPYVLALSLFVSGCEMLGPKLHEKLPLVPVNETEVVDGNEVVYQELSNETTDSSGENEVKIELYPGTEKFFSQNSAQKAKTTSGKGEYSLNFDDADLGEVAKVILSDILSENYVLSPKVHGKVTLQTSQPLTRTELLPTLEMLLQINNAGMVYQDGLYQITSKADALSSSAFTTYKNYRNRVPAGTQIRVVPVKNVAAEELAELIKPLLKDKTILHVDNGRNLMMLAGSAAELDRAMEMVNTFDVDVMKGRSFGMFPLHNVEAAKLITELEEVFNKGGGNSDQGFFQFIEIERLNAILAITQRAKYLKDIESWVLRLDRANTSSSGGGAIVYRVQHTDAVVLAETLNEIFSQSGQQSRSASVASGRKTVKVTNKNRRKTKTKRNTRVASVSDVGEVKIIADETNNALIIVATAQDYTVVQKVIKQLDVMPLQVLIDATIIDVTLTDDLEYGIQWSFNHANAGGAGNSGGLDLGATASNLALTAATGGAAPAAGFGYSFVSRSQDIRALLHAEAIKGNVNVISSPSIMVLNNQEASIQVGEERSLRTSESTPLSGGVGANNSLLQTTNIQQRKTGITVDVKPRVNANGLVIMEIEQTSENFAERNTNGNPDILTREIKSSIAVQSGETIVLGGLIQERNTHTTDGIPFLHELPIIGPIFGNTDKSKSKTELVLLITPRVVVSKLDARLVTQEFKRKLTGIYEEMKAEEVKKVY